MNLDPESSLGESKFDPESKIKIDPESSSKFKKIKNDPESKIKSDPELKIQDQNCDPESMTSKHSS